MATTSQIRFKDEQLLARHILQLSLGRPRTLVAITGIPGSGKSTLARHLKDAICHIAQRPGIVTVVPQDGFHLTNAELEARKLTARKGSPLTYRVQSFFSKLVEIKRATQSVLMPVYSRDIHEPIPDAIEVDPEIPIVLVEGNYILCNLAVWQSIASLFDLKIYCDVSFDISRERVIQRHHAGGLTMEEAIAKYDRNDVHNSKIIISSKAVADIVFDTSAQAS